jgi:hypothetical protein
VAVSANCVVRNLITIFCRIFTCRLVPPAGRSRVRRRAHARSSQATARCGYGLALRLRRGAEIVPVADATIRFRISRLHGPAALDRNLSRAIASAAQRLTVGDDIGAQRAIDGLQLTELSQDGALLACAISDDLCVPKPNLPTRATLRTWNARDIALHLPIYKLHVEAARALAKGVIPFDPQRHPRWPAGAEESQGGQFAPAGGASDASVIPVAVRRPKRPKRLPPLGLGDQLSEPPKGIGDNSGKFPELDVPQEEPPPEERYGVVTEIGQALQEALAAGASLWVRNTLQGLETIWWMKQITTNYYYQILASLDPPKTLQELQDAVKRPTLGYHIHHIVEWESGLADGFTVEQLQSPDNLVEIPEIKHRQISYWYQTRSDEFGGLSPRDYLRSKGWDEHWRIGIKALIKLKVLSP